MHCGLPGHKKPLSPPLNNPLALCEDGYVRWRLEAGFVNGVKTRYPVLKRVHPAPGVHNLVAGCTGFRICAPGRCMVLGNFKCDYIEITSGTITPISRTITPKDNYPP